MRESIGYSQERLAKEMKVTIRSISRWENGAIAIPKLAELALIECKKILRSVLPKKSSWIGYVSFIGHTRAQRLFELVTAKDLEGLVAKRKDGKYTAAGRWFKVLNPAYSQKAGRADFFQAGTRRGA